MENDALRLVEGAQFHKTHSPMLICYRKSETEPENLLESRMKTKLLFPNTNVEAF